VHDGDGGSRLVVVLVVVLLLLLRGRRSLSLSSLRLGSAKSNSPTANNKIHAVF
jgi:hypothetical protein